MNNSRKFFKLFLWHRFTIKQCFVNKYVSLNKSFYTLIIFLIISISLYGQKKSTHFQHFTTQDGLLQNMVDCIFQDSRGYMWFGTWNGLCRFDGYTFLGFKEENISSGELSNNFVHTICEDTAGNLWIGTDDGLNVYIYDENHFIHYNASSRVHPLNSNRVLTVISSQQGEIWAGTDKGAYRLLPAGSRGELDSIKYYPLNEGHDSVEIVVNSIIESRDNNIWLGTNNGLFKIDQNSGNISIFRHITGQENSLLYNVIQSLFEDPDGDIWIGTVYGLSKYDPDKGIFRNYQHAPNNPNSLVHNFVMSITMDHNGNLIVGTLGGISIYDPLKDDFINYTHKLNSISGLSNDFINCVYADKEGNTWIGTERGGVNKFNSSHISFEYYENEPGNRNSLSHNTINSVMEDADYLWIGTAGGGLNRYDKKSHRFKIYKYNSVDSNSLSGDFITSLIRDKYGRLWVGTWGNGLNLLANEGRANEKFVHFIPDPADPNSLVDAFISTIIKDKSGDLWIGTGGGLNRYSLKNGKFSGFDAHIENHELRQIGCLAFDADSSLWIGTRNGLFEMPSRTGHPERIWTNGSRMQYYQHNPRDSAGLSGNYVISILKDSKGNLWVGTYGFGLNKMVKAGNDVSFVHYDQKNGLPNNIIYSILEDPDGYLWLATDHGLSRFQPDSETFRNFYTSDGLQNDQYYWSASYSNDSGKLYVGGMNGLNAFMPGWIKELDTSPHVEITDFKIFNHKTEIGKEYSGNVVLSKIIDETDSLSLSYKSKEFSFEFSALEYDQPDLIEYKYKLEGFDQQWNHVTSNRRYASYTNLAPGKYVFLVKAKKRSGSWSAPTRLAITIIPPFWATWWFRLLMLVFVLAMIIGYNRYRVYALKKQKLHLEKQVKERTAKIEHQTIKLQHQAEILKENNIQLAHRQEMIEGQKLQLEHQNAEISKQRDALIELNKRVKQVNQMKLRFFTNISHEFRTPLTLILAPLEKILTKASLDDDVRNTLLLVNRNAKRLLHLINQLMDFRRIEKGKMDLKVSEGNLVVFLQGIVNTFRELAEERQIDLSFSDNGVPEKVWFDHEMLEKVIYNLLSNAFKYTPHNGIIWVSLGLCNETSDAKILRSKNHEADEFIEIKIGDTGVGISEEKLKNVFKRFYHTDSVDVRDAGSGIGLSLVKELMKTHHGDINAVSTPGAGSVFTAILPYRKESYEIAEISDKVQEEENITFEVSQLKDELAAIEPVEQHFRTLPRHEYPGKPTLLVVEDNADLRRYITAKLNTIYNVLDAPDGKIALEMANKCNPDLIVSDIMMPVMDGLALCRVIKEELATSHIPVILLTARGTIENQIEGFETGADDYVPKPFSFELLEARIRNLIESRQKLRKIFSGMQRIVPEEITTNKTDLQFIEKALHLVESNIGNSEFDVTCFAAEMNVSRSFLHKKLTAITDQSATDFINTIRLKKSSEMLSTLEYNVSEVAYAVGYNDPKYFSRIFKKQFGKAPSELLKVVPTNGKKMKFEV